MHYEYNDNGWVQLVEKVNATFLFVYQITISFEKIDDPFHISEVLWKWTDLRSNAKFRIYISWLWANLFLHIIQIVHTKPQSHFRFSLWTKSESTWAVIGEVCGAFLDHFENGSPRAFWVLYKHLCGRMVDFGRFQTFLSLKNKKKKKHWKNRRGYFEHFSGRLWYIRLLSSRNGQKNVQIIFSIFSFFFSYYFSKKKIYIYTKWPKSTTFLCRGL